MWQLQSGQWVQKVSHQWNSGFKILKSTSDIEEAKEEVQQQSCLSPFSQYNLQHIAFTPNFSVTSYKLPRRRSSDRWKIWTQTSSTLPCWTDCFTFKGCYHLEFEKLEYMEMRSSSGSLELQEIRPIVQQVCVFSTEHKLHSSKTIDFPSKYIFPVKLQTIMMVDHVQQILKLLVIDFCLACREPKKYRGAVPQTLWYR